MKHRSVVIFSIIVMALAVMPEASQRLSELAGAAENRVKTGIWNAFLSLHAQTHEAPEARPVSPRSTSEGTELAARRVRAGDRMERGKIAPASQRRNADRLETETLATGENSLVESHMRAAEVVEVAWLEAMPDAARLSKELASAEHARRIRRVAEQDILVDPDTELPPPVNTKNDPKIKDVARVVWRFAEQGARNSGARRDVLIKFRRKAAMELKNLNLSADYANEIPKATPSKPPCSSTLLNPAPPAETESGFETDHAFDTRM